MSFDDLSHLPHRNISTIIQMVCCLDLVSGLLLNIGHSFYDKQLVLTIGIRSNKFGKQKDMIVSINIIFDDVSDITFSNYFTYNNNVIKSVKWVNISDNLKRVTCVFSSLEGDAACCFVARTVSIKYLNPHRDFQMLTGNL